MKLRSVIEGVLILLFGAIGTAATATEATSQACRARADQSDARPRIGLALGGGGARGVAHVSILRKLEELRVPIDCVAGTSVGAAVGAMYASGMSIDAIEKYLLETDWERMFDDSLDRRERSLRRKRDDELVIATPGIGIGAGGVKIAAGLLAGERLLLSFGKLIEPVSTIEDFDRLPIPFRAVAADINSGEPLEIRTGDLALAMRASMSIPGFFPPVQIGEQIVVDGGLARNLPIDTVRKMGADIIIAVDVGTPLGVLTIKSDVLAITEQVSGLLTVRNTQEQLATLTERDVLISPPLGERVGTGAFDKGAEALAIGAEGALAASDSLERYTLSEQAFTQHVALRRGRQSGTPMVEFVRMDNQSRYRDELLLSWTEIPVGKPLDSARLEAALLRVYGNNTLSQASYEVVEEAGRTGVVLHFREKAHGPNYVEAGLTVSSDFDGSFDFGVRVGIRQSPINARGGEMRYLLRLGDESGLMAEYYQPFGEQNRYSVALRAQYDNRPIRLFDDNLRQIAEYDAKQTGMALTAGREFGNYAALNVGVQRFTGSADVVIGDAALPNLETDSGEAFVEATLDRLDSFYFPREGYFAQARYVFSRESLGADTEFDQFGLDAFAAKSLGKHSGQLGLRYHVTHSGVAPVQSLYRVGGYSRLVGFHPQELSGQNYAVLLGGYSYQIGKLFDQKALAGFLLEYGNAWQRRDNMAFDAALLNGSVYIGLDTWLGPVLFGVGAREGGARNVFLELGHRF